MTQSLPLSLNMPMTHYDQVFSARSVGMNFSPAFQRRDQVGARPRRVATIESSGSFRRRYATRTPR
jgi:hypothetical protein